MIILIQNATSTPAVTVYGSAHQETVDDLRADPEHADCTIIEVPLPQNGFEIPVFRAIDSLADDDNGAAAIEHIIQEVLKHQQ